MSQDEICNKIFLQIIDQLGIFRQWYPSYWLACEQNGAYCLPCWDLLTLMIGMCVLLSSGNRISRYCTICLGNVALYMTFNFANQE